MCRECEGFGGGGGSKLERLSFLFCVALYEHCYDVKEKISLELKVTTLTKRILVAFFIILDFFFFLMYVMFLLSSNQLVAVATVQGRPLGLVHDKARRAIQDEHI